MRPRDIGIPITRAQALEIARRILERAERERIEADEREAGAFEFEVEGKPGTAPAERTL